MKRRPHRPEAILVCPKCRSTAIYLIAGMIVGQVYRCERCGYQGSLVLEVDVPPSLNPRDP